MAHWVKNLLAMQETQETWVRSLGWEDSLEEEMATHSSILQWRIPWTEEPGGFQTTGSQKVRHNSAAQHMHEYTHTHTQMALGYWDVSVEKIKKQIKIPTLLELTF